MESILLEINEYLLRKYPYTKNKLVSDGEIFIHFRIHNASGDWDMVDTTPVKGADVRSLKDWIKINLS